MYIRISKNKSNKKYITKSKQTKFPSTNGQFHSSVFPLRLGNLLPNCLSSNSSENMFKTLLSKTYKSLPNHKNSCDKSKLVVTNAIENLFLKLLKTCCSKCHSSAFFCSFLHSYVK